MENIKNKIYIGFPDCVETDCGYLEFKFHMAIYK